MHRLHHIRHYCQGREVTENESMLSEQSDLRIQQHSDMFHMSLSFCNLCSANQSYRTNSFSVI